jgi:hypothetical protein
MSVCAEIESIDSESEILVSPTFLISWAEEKIEKICEFNGRLAKLGVRAISPTYKIDVTHS